MAIIRRMHHGDKGANAYRALVIVHGYGDVEVNLEGLGLVAEAVMLDASVEATPRVTTKRKLGTGIYQCAGL